MIAEASKSRRALSVRVGVQTGVSPEGAGVLVRARRGGQPCSGYWVTHIGPPRRRLARSLARARDSPSPRDRCVPGDRMPGPPAAKGRAVGEAALKASNALCNGCCRGTQDEDSKDFRVRRLREARIGHAAARAVFFALHIYVMAVLCTFPESPIRMGLIGKRQHTAYDDPTTPQNESLDPMPNYNYPAYAGVFFAVFFVNVLLYVIVARSKPGYVDAGEEHQAFRGHAATSDANRAVYLADAGREREVALAPVNGAHAHSHDNHSHTHAHGHDHGHDHSHAHALWPAPEGDEPPASTLMPRGARAGPGPVAESQEGGPKHPGAERATAAGGRDAERGPADGQRALRSGLLGSAKRNVAVIRYDPESGRDPEHGDVGPIGRYCGQCGLWQAPRVKHCYDCGRCVRRFDHHCVWVGNCVGRDNQRLFFAFSTTQTVLVTWAFSACCEAFAYSMKWAKWASGDTLLVVTAILLAFIMVPMCLLWVGQVYLILTNSTTYEQTKEDHPTALWYLDGLPEHSLAFNHGPWANVVDFFTLSPRLDERLTAEEIAAPQGETWYHNRHFSCCG